MDNKVLVKKLQDYVRSQYPDHDLDDSDLLKEYLLESTTVHEEHLRSHRWWDDWMGITNVPTIGLVAFEYAKANRDESMEDLGWKFDPSTICLMEEYEKTVKAYCPI